ncbi:hypothetical protein L1887_47105 [Cichorium endivia]|nr:hypothetical protein L1887_47105 [Cichorium endivia]
MVVRIWEGEGRIFANASTSAEVRLAKASERATVARPRRSEGAEGAARCGFAARRSARGTSDGEARVEISADALSSESSRRPPWASERRAASKFPETRPQHGKWTSEISRTGRQVGTAWLRLAPRRAAPISPSFKGPVEDNQLFLALPTDGSASTAMGASHSRCIRSIRCGTRGAFAPSLPWLPHCPAAVLRYRTVGADAAASYAHPRRRQPE